MKNFFQPIIQFTFILLLSASVEATWISPEDIPKNYKPSLSETANMTETEFREIIKNFQTIYGPIATKHGGRLSISGDWKSETPNAGANQIFGTWQIKITGGLARRPELTQDGFSLIMCHELGHHFGGFVIAPSPVPVQKAWAANEGQADYYSTQFCARKIWGSDLNKNAEFRKTRSEKIQKACDRVWRETVDQDLCYRTLTAVESMTTTMAAIKKVDKPDFETPDPSAVDRTNHEHPAVQCRMDTTLQGALCQAQFDPNVIPGKTVQQGIDSIEAEREAAQYSCTAVSGFQTGLRPNCWFKARL